LRALDLSGNQVGWRPILDDELALAVQAALRELAAQLERGTRPWHDSPTTLVELATVFAYLERAGLSTVDAGAFIERGVSALIEVPLGPQLIGGLTGVGWTVAHLTDVPTADAVCGAIDDAVLVELDPPRWDGPYDLILGLAGMGLYALERLDSDTGRRLAVRALDHLETAAQPQDSGSTWLTTRAHTPEHRRRQFPDGYYDIGAAHGVPGVIGVLARYVMIGVEVDRATRLLRAAVSWLLAIPSARPGPGRYPVFLAPGQETGPPARLAWCYGDPGIAICLLAAAHAVGDGAWERAAIDLALAAAARQFDGSEVFDTALCHGAGGLAHVFNRLYQATAIDAFADAARRWFECVLCLRRPGEGIAGFAKPGAGDPTPWEANPTLLAGAPGTALALLAAVTDVEPAWDRRLLMDLPLADTRVTRVR
jgi:lantibiotic biosynthesis protein